MIAFPILSMTISLFLVVVSPLLLKLVSDAVIDFNEQRSAIDGPSDEDRPNE